ncbi:formimidoylglutamate deiminase [Hoeflea poritis]|uniref:Formimidoylglutamate deiminase n=1 Tax=Hoeflea poritis TaxID=2993659 RepID=A0ABT4VV24_9HYPH|nr:formimidoylglutamate deiminase [Hoeflea poritis]MDA4848551.1 formimidoylglutamate deiminase [Hoeflea poritis]
MHAIYAKQALTPKGWASDVEIKVGPDGQITNVTENSPVRGQVRDLVLPAPVNLHSHAFQRAMAGLTETRSTDPRDTFWSWRKLMYQFLDRLTPEQVEAIANLVFMEMLEAGYAGVTEFHYLHHSVGGAVYSDLGEMSGRIISAAKRTGIGLTLLPALYTYGGCNRRPLEGGQQRFGNDLTQFSNLYDAARAQIADAPDDFEIGVAPHSLRAVSAEDFASVVESFGNGPIHMHLAEQVAEVDEVQAALGARPVEWLLDNAQVDSRWCLIHTTQMTDAETAGLAQSGAVSGLCPITESSLGDGVFNGVEYSAQSGRYGIGSDSNVHIALFDELATLEYSQRLRDRCRAALATPERSTGRALFDAVATGGAQASGRDSGRIEVGRQADLIGLSTDNEWICGRTGDACLDSLIFGGRGRECITDVWSAGRHVVKSGRHVKRDAIVEEFRKVITELGQHI